MNLSTFFVNAVSTMYILPSTDRIQILVGMSDRPTLYFIASFYYHAEVIQVC